ncbi:glycosyltransferase [Gelidibacter sp. F2691]|nr:glycosyltransferase [Gelidibacter sp. F2691]
MKLGILIYSLSGGGAERAVSYLLQYCVEKDIDVQLFLMNTNIDFELPVGLKVHFLEHSKFHESGIIKALKIPILAYKYSILLKKLEITHSLSFLSRPSFINVLASKLTNYKFNVIVNERAFPTLQYSYKGFQSTFNKMLIKKLYKKSDFIISNSQGNAKDLIDNFEVPSNKIKVIHNSIDLVKINNIPANQTFFDTKTFNIVTVGRMDKGKNHELLIRAIAKLRNPAVRLYIFGFGDLKIELEQLIENLNLKNQVFLMGFDPSPYQYLKAADLFMFGSNHEGFPNVLLEAMACGLPILSSNCQSGPSEIMELQSVKDDLMITDYGILVPIKNIDLMAKGLDYFLNNNNYIKRCKANNLIRVKDFEKQKVLNEYLNLIKMGG